MQTSRSRCATAIGTPSDREIDPNSRAASERAGRAVLRQDLLDHPSADIREAEVAALVPVGQLLVVKPETVQQRSLQVVHMDLALDRLQADVVSIADDPPSGRAASGQPHAEAVGMVVPAGILVLAVLQPIPWLRVQFGNWISTSTARQRLPTSSRTGCEASLSTDSLALFGVVGLAW